MTKIFTFKDSELNLKAVVQNSIIGIGGKVYFDCEVENFTNVTIKTLKISLQELYIFVKHKEYVTKVIEKVKHTESETCSIKSGEKQKFDFVVDVPNDIVSLEFSSIVARQYVVVICAKLPIPHRNLDLWIPLQIGDVIDTHTVSDTNAELETYTETKSIVNDDHVVNGGPSTSEGPPTYWEAMSEEKDDFFALVDKK